MTSPRSWEWERWLRRERRLLRRRGDGDLDLTSPTTSPDQLFPEPGAEPTCQWLGMAVMCGRRSRGAGDVFYRNEGLVRRGDEGDGTRRPHSCLRDWCGERRL
jgi:hypothetical protein